MSRRGKEKRIGLCLSPGPIPASTARRATVRGWASGSLGPGWVATDAARCDRGHITYHQPSLSGPIAYLGLEPHLPPKLSGHLMRTAPIPRTPACPVDPWAGGGKKGLRRRP